MDTLVLVVVLGAVFAGFVQGLSGFAFSMCSMSIWAWAVEPQLAAVLAVFGGLTGQIITAFSVRRGFNRALLLPFLIGGLAGIPLGVAVLPHLDMLLFKAVLGGFLALWCPFLLIAWRLPRVTFGGRWADGIVGVIGGAMGGIGGFSGAIPTLWCSLRGMEKDTQRTVIQNFNLSILAVTMASYVATGAVRLDMLPWFAIVGLAVLVPSLLGARLYLGISEATFRVVVLVLLTLSGCALLAASMPKLLG